MTKKSPHDAGTSAIRLRSSAVYGPLTACHHERSERRLNVPLSRGSTGVGYQPHTTPEKAMFRTLYGLCIISLLASTAWTAAGASSTSAQSHAGLGLVLLAALQR
jgi:hypothetical protein